MSEDAFDLETAVVPHHSISVVTWLVRRSIHHLPVEILAEIFVQCIPLLVPSEQYKLPEFEVHPQRILVNLALVCRLWRDVLNHEPRVWATLALDSFESIPNLKIVSSWLKKSKSCPLDVYINDDSWLPYGEGYPAGVDPVQDITELLYNELPRIRTLFVTDNVMDKLSTLPAICGGHTVLPRMECLNLLNYDCFSFRREWKALFSFPQLRTLVLREFGLLIDGSMENVRHLDITEYTPQCWQNEEGMFIGKPCWSCPLLQTVPNLVSLTWNIRVSFERPEQPVVLKSLQSLSLPSYYRYRSDTLKALECFVAPSLKDLDLDLGVVTPPRSHEVMLKEALDVICRDRSVQLRRLTLRCSPQLANCQLEDLRAISPHLSHLDTFTIRDPRERLRERSPTSSLSGEAESD